MTGQDYFNQIKNIAASDGMPPELSTLIAGQAVHETGNFTSNVFLQDNNCFGYKAVPGAIWQEGNGRTSPEGNDYAKYSSIANSVHELTAWIIRRLNENKFPLLKDITSASLYAVALKNCGYYGDSINNYEKGINNAVEEYA